MPTTSKHCILDLHEHDRDNYAENLNKAAKNLDAYDPVAISLRKLSRRLSKLKLF
jgi:hypothetical protein